MDSNSPIPDEEMLRRMPFSELKKLAVEKGIMKKRRSMKNKEMKFNVDVVTPLATPRRGTYILASPIIGCDLAEKVKADSGSSPVPQNSSALDISNVTILRGSERKLRPRKVSFVSPKNITPHTSKYMSLKDRPKTPIPSRSTSRRTSLATSVRLKNSAKNTSINTDIRDIQGSYSNLNRTIPGNAPKSESKEDTVTKIKRAATPNFKVIHQKAFDKMESIDDYQQRKKKESAKKLAPITKSKVSKVKTKIPVAFNGIPFIPSVTSCRNLKFDFCSRIPNSFNGEKKKVSQPMNRVSTRSEGKQKAKIENIPVGNKKMKFDLQASLSRKLGYKPYTGPLKPLCESNCISSPKVVCHHGSEKEPLNNVVHLKRNQSRNVLRGVRTNKRFDLQMKNRMVK